MEKTSFLLIIAFSVLSVDAQLQKAEFQASGLTCSMCSNAINKALKTVPFIETINTDLNKNIFSLVFKKDQPVDLDLIKKKVEDAGFSIAKFWVIANVHDLKIENDEHAVVDGVHLHFMNVKQQTLNGGQRLQIIDKDFVLAREYKRNSVYTSMSCYKTGNMAACCKSPVAPAGTSTRIYHVTI